MFTWRVIATEQGRDWVAYAEAAERLVSGGPLYSRSLGDPTLASYLYPPPLAALWAVGIGPAGLLIVKLAALLGLAPLGALLAGPVDGRTRIAGGFALVALGLAATPVVYDLVLGNVMTLYVGAIGLAVARRGWSGATLLGVVCAVALKPFVGPFLLWLLLRRRGDALRTVAVGLGVSALAAVVIGPGRYLEYVEALPRMLTIAHPFTGNVGLITSSPFAAATGLVIAYAAAIVAASPRLAEPAGAAIALGVTLAAQPTIGFNYSGVLLPAVAVLWLVDRRVAVVAGIVTPIVVLVSPVLAGALIAAVALAAGRQAVARSSVNPEAATSVEA
jgi:hypothetical protein